MQSYQHHELTQLFHFGKDIADGRLRYSSIFPCKHLWL